MLIYSFGVLSSYNQIQVSIITPLFNAARFIPRLIQTVQEQQGVIFEHIIVNDCSTDDSLRLLKKFEKSFGNVRVINLNKNAGVVHARNIAIEAAKGRYLAFLDADDLWLPDKLNIQVNFMRKNDLAFTFTDYRAMSEDGAKIGMLIRGPMKIGWTLHHVTRYIGCSTVMLDSKQIPKCLFDERMTKYLAEDFIAWSNIIRKVGFAVRCPHDLVRYIILKKSRSSNKVSAVKSIWKIYRKKEQISFSVAVIYLFLFIVFSLVKKYLCAPYFQHDFFMSNIKGSYRS